MNAIPPDKLSQDDINNFAAKLSKWSEKLSAEERSLAQLLVQHARELTPQAVALTRITADLRASAKRIVSSIIPPNKAAEAWVRIDPVWERKNKVEFGEDVMLIQRLLFKSKN